MDGSKNSKSHLRPSPTYIGTYVGGQTLYAARWLGVRAPRGRAGSRTMPEATPHRWPWDTANMVERARDRRCYDISLGIRDSSSGIGNNWGDTNLHAPPRDARRPFQGSFKPGLRVSKKQQHPLNKSPKTALWITPESLLTGFETSINTICILLLT